MRTENRDIFDLKGKIAVVTGGMGLLGVAHAGSLLERGVKVAVFDVATKPKAYDKRFDKGLQTGALKLFRVDVTKKAQIERACKALLRLWGCPHILINNAAIDSPPNAQAADVGPFETYPVGSFEKVVDVDVKGAFLCSQIIGGAMARAGRGSVINISSTYGILSPRQDIYEFRRVKGEAFYKPVAYSVSKSAILNLTRYLATYWAKKGVRVNTLILGGVFNDQPKEFLESYCHHVPMGRMADSSEMKGAVVFLSSNASSYVTGSSITVDGGWSAW